MTTLSLASCFNNADVYTVQTKVTAEGKIIQTPRLVSVAKLRQEAEAPGPKAVADATVHDFGRLNPLTTHQHSFVIRNVGDAPLELTEGPTTCKCTLAKLAQHTVLPGDKVAVSVRWNTGRDLEYCAQRDDLYQRSTKPGDSPEDPGQRPGAVAMPA